MILRLSQLSDAASERGNKLPTRGWIGFSLQFMGDELSGADVRRNRQMFETRIVVSPVARIRALRRNAERSCPLHSRAVAQVWVPGRHQRSPARIGADGLAARVMQS
jgi:hypothetical protein